MYWLVVLFVVVNIAAAGYPLSAGLRASPLVPIPHQSLGPNVLIPLNYGSRNGLTIANAVKPSGGVQQHTSVSKDALGGHTIEHAAHGHHTNPYTGAADVKHSEHAFHINPYLGKAAAHSNDATGYLSPLSGSAAYQENSYDAKIAPDHRALKKGYASAHVSPHGNHANHAVHSAHAAAVPGGVVHAAHTSQAAHANHPGLGGYTKSQVSDVQGLQGHGFSALSQAAQKTRASYGPHGLSAEVKQDGYAADDVYNVHLNYVAGNEHAYTHQARRDPHLGYEQVTRTTNTAHAGPIYPSPYGAPAPVHHSSYGYSQASYSPVHAVHYAPYGHKK
ncbi:histidine-rich protein PFHRP-II-like [Limulus polyphemus]|uniref:Histidine-rich protein PFHRP-II-like n=1 Tax=Limulus polyphemus TaxID=6850 RepID=A0ABM1BAZ0_LIMPO|nr:histidine-rich protein PFHRP-II-like [Limulus polyphemus]